MSDKKEIIQSTNRTERQAHGFDYEDYIIEKYGLTEETKYNAKWDAYFNGIPVSIKACKKGNSVYMADFYRNAAVDYNFILVVGYWEKRKDPDTQKEVRLIVQEVALYINKGFWQSQFPKEGVDKMRSVFEGITNSKEDNQKWIERRKEYVKEWNSYDSIISIHFKRDSKKQLRTQCSIKRVAMEELLIPYYSVRMDEIFSDKMSH